MGPVCFEIGANTDSKFGPRLIGNRAQIDSSCATERGANQKCAIIQEVLLRVARTHEKTKTSQAQVPDNAQEKIKNAIKERKELKKIFGLLFILTLSGTMDMEQVRLLACGITRGKLWEGEIIRFTKTPPILLS